MFAVSALIRSPQKSSDLEAGDTILLSGKMLTGRDAA